METLKHDCILSSRATSFKCGQWNILSGIFSSHFINFTEDIWHWILFFSPNKHCILRYVCSSQYGGKNFGRFNCWNFTVCFGQKLRSVFVRGAVIFFLAGKIFYKNVFNYLQKLLPGETLCKFFQIFPPKDLVQKREGFSWHFFIDNYYLIECNKEEKNDNKEKRK